ncbi:MAG TPA: hypothetical protein PLH92_08725 [Mycobacterium sp.]|uniref:hypothetical protein n=1 Tax=Mycolicibacterium sp. TaxID=2320850 RepID=UPI0025F512AC|nr:hypothetical protein [Mycolicibacterium sp.]HPX36597.1 hypothetical protein [Mycobacterium sp.]HQC76790.1 hypothetical protein [Mycobacterium sp.]
MTVRLRSVTLLAALVFAGGCATMPEPATSPLRSPASTPASAPAVTAPPEVSPEVPRAAAIRDWERRTGDLFKRSAHALQQISQATDAGDESAVRSGCQQLHDVNAVELQHLLPTPDPELTAGLQRMIDDMNVATHACLRFVIARQSDDTITYQDYLARAVDHLQQAKSIVDADLREG